MAISYNTEINDIKLMHVDLNEKKKDMVLWCKYLCTSVRYMIKYKI